MKSVSNSALKNLDLLVRRGVISDNEMCSLRTKEKEDRARDVIDVVRAKGNESSLFLISALHEMDPYLSRKLKLS